MLCSWSLFKPTELTLNSSGFPKSFQRWQFCQAVVPIYSKGGRYFISGISATQQLTPEESSWINSTPGTRGNTNLFSWTPFVSCTDQTHQSTKYIHYSVFSDCSFEQHDSLTVSKCAEAQCSIRWFHGLRWNVLGEEPLNCCVSEIPVFYQSSMLCQASGEDIGLCSLQPTLLSFYLSICSPPFQLPLSSSCYLFPPAIALPPSSSLLPIALITLYLLLSLSASALFVPPPSLSASSPPSLSRLMFLPSVSLSSLTVLEWFTSHCCTHSHRSLTSFPQPSWGLQTVKLWWDMPALSFIICLRFAFRGSQLS